MHFSARDIGTLWTWFAAFSGCGSVGFVTDVCSRWFHLAVQWNFCLHRILFDLKFRPFFHFSHPPFRWIGADCSAGWNGQIWPPGGTFVDCWIRVELAAANHWIEEEGRNELNIRRLGSVRSNQVAGYFSFQLVTLIEYRMSGGEKPAECRLSADLCVGGRSRSDRHQNPISRPTAAHKSRPIKLITFQID